MRKNELVAIALFLVATVGTVGSIFAIEGVRRSRHFTAELTVRAPEHGNFHPQTLVIPSGQEVRILIRNIDTVSHGFAVPALDVAVPEIKAGQAKIVTFVATKTGSFPFMCTIWCSDRHMEMSGNLRIE